MLRRNLMDVLEKVNEQGAGDVAEKIDGCHLLGEPVLERGNGPLVRNFLLHAKRFHCR
jgi:hypothetical protein